MIAKGCLLVRCCNGFARVSGFVLQGQFLQMDMWLGCWCGFLAVLKILGDFFISFENVACICVRSNSKMNFLENLSLLFIV